MPMSSSYIHILENTFIFAKRKDIPNVFGINRIIKIDSRRPTQFQRVSICGYCNRRYIFTAEREEQNPILGSRLVKIRNKTKVAFVNVWVSE
jgi:hypothetical protein